MCIYDCDQKNLKEDNADKASSEQNDEVASFCNIFSYICTPAILHIVKNYRKEICQTSKEPQFLFHSSNDILKILNVLPTLKRE